MPSATTPHPPPYRVGIIGYGLSAKIFHIPFITSPTTKDLYTLAAIVQRTPSPTNDPKSAHAGVTVYRSTTELFADDSIDVVIVTTAPESHYELARSAIEAGKHVVVEKPFTPTSSAARELVDLATRHGVFLTVYQNRRFDADFILLASLLAEDKLGRVAEFETHFDRHRPAVPAAAVGWKNVVAPGTGAAYDLGTHLMDQVVCLFGMPRAVTGFVGSQRVGGPPGFEDSATILLHYGDETSGKLLVTAKAGVVSPESEQLRYWVRGEKGGWKKFHLDPQEDQLRAGMRPGDEGYGLEGPDRYGVLTEVGADGAMKTLRLPSLPADYSVYYLKLAAALKAGDPTLLPVDANVAVGVIRLVELARESTRLGKTIDV